MTKRERPKPKRVESWQTEGGTPLVVFSWLLGVPIGKDFATNSYSFSLVNGKRRHPHLGFATKSLAPPRLLARQTGLAHEGKG